MAEDRGCGGFGFGGDWIWWIVIIIIVVLLINPGFFGGFGFGCKE